MKILAVFAILFGLLGPAYALFMVVWLQAPADAVVIGLLGVIFGWVPPMTMVILPAFRQAAESIASRSRWDAVPAWAFIAALVLLSALSTVFITIGIEGEPNSPLEIFRPLHTIGLSIGLLSGTVCAAVIALFPDIGSKHSSSGGLNPPSSGRERHSIPNYDSQHNPPVHSYAEAKIYSPPPTNG